MVGGDVLLAEPLTEGVGHPLGEAPGVDEDQGLPVLRDQGGDAIVELGPLLVGADRAELVLRDEDLEVEVALEADVDDVGKRRARADEEARGDLDRANGRGEADALRTREAILDHEIFEALDAEREVRAALVPGERVDFVEDHRANRGERPAPRRAGEEHVERLGRRHQHVRCLLHRLAPLLLRGVAGADRGANARHRDPPLLGEGGNFESGSLEVLLDVVGERAERRDVDDLGLVLERPGGRGANQPIEAIEERCERLARSCRRGDEGVAPAGDGRPGAELRVRRPREARVEPRLDELVEHRSERYITDGGREDVVRARLLMFSKTREIYLATRKKHDLLFNAYFMRPIAAFVVGIVAPTGVTPNQLTILNLFVFAISAALLIALPKLRRAGWSRSACSSSATSSSAPTGCWRATRRSPR